MRQVLILVLLFLPVTINPPVLHNHLHLHVAVIMNTTGCSLRVVTVMFLRISEKTGQPNNFTFLGLGRVRLG